MGTNTEKKQWTNLQNSYKNLSKEIKSDNICYCKVGRAITKWKAMEEMVTKIISHIIFLSIVCSRENKNIYLHMLFVICKRTYILNKREH